MRNKLGIIGKPLGHSLSPILHTNAIEKLSVDLTYESWEIEENELKEFLDEVRSSDSTIAGFNVTIPYKEKIIPLLDSIDYMAEELQAVNTVKYENGILKGYNTDGLGFFESLIRNGVEYKDKRILILGSGGACNGISIFLAKNGVTKIDIVSIEADKGSMLVSRLKTKGVMSQFFEWGDLKKIDVQNYNIIIQTTPLGMKHFKGTIDFPYEKLEKTQSIVDIVYNPLETEFIKNCKISGAKCISGLEMLIYQGFHSFKIWTGLEEDTDLMLAIGKKILEEKVE